MRVDGLHCFFTQEPLHGRPEVHYGFGLEFDSTDWWKLWWPVMSVPGA